MKELNLILYSVEQKSVLLSCFIQFIVTKQGEAFGNRKIFSF